MLGQLFRSGKLTDSTTELILIVTQLLSQPTKYPAARDPALPARLVAIMAAVGIRTRVTRQKRK